MSIVEPGDPWQIAKILEASLDYEGPLYIRMGREAQVQIYEEDYQYEIGKAITVREGSDGAFICSGITVHMALDAAKKLESDLGAKISVIDMHTIKPIDKDAVLKAARTGKIVTAQDHNIIGGLGYQVAPVIVEAGVPCKVKMLGCPDHFVPLATTEYLYKKNGYDVDGLYENMKAML
jgi:transketolase